MGSLCVIDVSAIIYTGINSPRYRDMTSFGYPTGGINFLMKQLLVPMYEANDVVLCFDSQNFRKQKMPDYKSGRAHSSSAISQIEVMYEYLSLCGVACYKIDGYEADDIIEWVVAENCLKYDNVIIVGNDMDLCHSIRPNVIFRSCRSDMNFVKKSSFPHAVKKDVYIPYNMVSAYKCLCGCPSDSVPAFRRDNGIAGMELYKDCVETYQTYNLVNNWQKSANPNVLRVWAKQVQQFSESEMERLDERIQIIFPADRPDGIEIQPCSIFSIDSEKMSRVLTMFNISDALHDGQFWRVQLTEGDKQTMYQLADSLRSGRFNADKNLPLDTDRISSQPLTIDSFTKDF